MNYTINNYRSKKFGDNHFVTTDHGSYCVLSEEEFRKLRRNDIRKELKGKLEEKGVILTGLNVNKTIKLLKKRNSFLYSGTSLHIIVVTLRCNMNCIYCHANSKPVNNKGFDMDKKTARRTVDFIFQTPNKGITIEFQGGEPLLNWEVVKHIIEYSQEKNKEAKKNLRITVVTNLTEMDEKKMKYLIEHDVDICTSLDGPQALHDHNRRFIGGSNYEQVTNWVKRFYEEYEKRMIKNRKPNALVTLTRESLNYPREIVDEYLKVGLTDIHLRFLNNLGVAKQTWPSINYSVKEYLDFWKESVEYIEELRRHGKDINERMVNIISNKINNEFDPNYLDLRSPCGAAIGQLAYNYDGNIYVCDEARMVGDDLFLLGNVNTHDYKEIVTCDKACAVISASINDQYICNDCAYKPYCGICPVCNYAEQGSVIGKITQTKRCSIFKEQFDWIIMKKFIKKK